MNKQSLYEGFKKVYNSVVGVKTTSSFHETGTLTPMEFIQAGDELLHKMPVWSWAEGPENIQPFLPPNKKYLVYRGAPCYERAAVAGNDDADEIVEDDDDEWITTHANRVLKATTEIAAEKTINWDDDDDDDDDANNNNNVVVVDSSRKDEGDDDEDADRDQTERRRCRLYDVYMVYDQYYQTPRIFLIGYAEDHVTPLTTSEMMEDVYPVNRERTVSIDPHPFLQAACISIHPCRHAETMRRMIQHMKQRFEESSPETAKFVFPTHMALFLFLKFISSAVPSIEYDLSTGIDI
ncbi:autophagocytosis associated protein, putative [Trypanosoma brucei gambiense DAL972]|uniref:Autophagocytosis associated protein, putative n=1 Tax=Trypanosoma brucei gambiense (strain MHOM/CI/86/DAL972) TaxID=679716 RepID=C9ZIW6_TRYB9|nr:autophagocytosis associated protein, putative [Trypanosoma brucei gambiense DAL972]CBH09332.1 autophagocytosis associated protein, putative [Trypanosoma brucei gambiense DAL972]|eukprot:XP_011771640.1 autophagocytosis associated protein, putative [Trypanosoma brucei gambiense DAL972]